MRKLLLLVLLLWQCLAHGQATYQNPVLPGFYPDPSICRVGDDFYLVDSSFAYYPGVPIFHSKNLANWDQIGYVLSRPEQLPLAGGPGIFAPTLRYHAGTFYLITTNLGGKGNFYVTATNPAGPWSDPVWVAMPGIDPSLFFDDDGRVYVTSANNWGPTKDGILLSEIDLQTGKLLTAPIGIWQGTGGRYPEGPHLYKKDGFYYLLIAEGGTEYGHGVTIARSKTLAGPYLANPANPLLTHASFQQEDSPIQGTGHADVVQTASGAWFMVALGFRPIDNHQFLGRETFLAPMTWAADAWPVVNGGHGLALTMPAGPLPGGPVTTPDYRQQDDFSGPALGLNWNYLRNPVAANYSLTARPGYLRLRGAANTLGEFPGATFAGRRQQQFDFTATTTLDFTPTPTGQEEAGLTVFHDPLHYYQLAVRQGGRGRELVLAYRLGHIRAVAQRVALPPGPVRLRVTGTPEFYEFAYAQGPRPFARLGQVETRYLSTETAGGFTGVYLGLFATGNGQPAQAAADFDDFSYLPTPPISAKQP